MNTKLILDQLLVKLKTEVFNSVVEETLSKYSLPPNSLEPKKVWEQKIRKRLLDLYSGQAAVNKTIAGFDAIANDLYLHLGPEEFEKIEKEWKKGLEKWTELAKEPTTTKSECLLEMIGISEETLTQFYQAANRYYIKKDFQKASDAFYAIVGLDYRRYHIWLALGLSEAQKQQFEPALISFSMASILNKDTPYPYIYSAECCLEDHRIEEAKKYLALAQKAINDGNMDDKQKLFQSIQKLNQYTQ
jgi:tetratricopeptide (TPR) repeat protein